MLLKRAVLCIIALCLMSLQAYAADPLTVRLEDIHASSGVLTLYAGANAALSPDNVTLEVGNNIVPVTGVRTVRDTGEGVSYLVMVDVSGSIKPDTFNALKDLLRVLITNMRSIDNVAVMPLGNDIKIAPFNPPSRELELLDQLTSSDEDTNLYRGIVKALQILASDTAVHDKRCLIILSDGEDYFTTGITREEVNDAVRMARLPVFTVAMLRPSIKPSVAESSKILGSFARLSAMGLDLTYGIDDTSANTIAQRITDAALDGYVMTADLSGVEVSSDTCRVELTVTSDGSTVFDARTIGASIIARALPSATPEPSSEPATALSPSPRPTVARPSPSPTPAPKNSPVGTILMAVLAVICLAGGGVLLYYVLVRRKKQVEQPTPPPPSRPVPPHPPRPRPEHRPHYRYEIRLTELHRSDNVHKARMESELLIGRDSSRAQLTLPNDALMSGVHCKLYDDGERMYVEDCASTNGTYLNGIPVTSRQVVEPGDVLYIGKTEWRVSWEEL